ncbi:filament-like plant protein 7 isoform X1 [Salvia splendens]|uniref:filament-like plant protein 7 isoform X1 n=2 Tax=Salvia splendens TaxID=180675 RepID=UPI001C2573ED|nr:filament-like plant protein 7 isoform X1 [Salvia splendens]
MMEIVMDQKTWLWRRKSSEKTILASSDEAQSVSSDKEDLQNSLKLLNEKLAFAAEECSAKDELVLSFKREAELAAADREKAEEEIGRLKQELDEAQQQRSAANERLGDLNSTLKNCMEQLNLARREQEQRMHDAVMQTSEEFEKSHKKLEEKLSETRKRLASLTSENSYLSRALIVKEKLVEDLNSVKIQAQAELEALMARLDSVEKENAFLRYEFRSVEKELELKNEEVGYSRRSAEASHKQHLENVKKIKKLEMECQRLRGLTRKRLPSPPMLSRDIEAQGRYQMTTRKKATCGGSPMQDRGDVYGFDNMTKQLGFLIDQVQDLQKENTIFKEFLAKKDEEISQLRKLKDSESREKSERKLLTNTAEADEISSRALALVAECQMIGASEMMSLMDDFVEMEKLAIVAVDGSFDASEVDSNALALVVRDNYSETGQELKAKDKKPDDDWLQNVTNMILEKHNASKRSIDELLEDIRLSSHSIRHPEASSQPLPITGYITWKSPPSSPSPTALIQEPSTEFMQPEMNRSITKLIELVGDLKPSKADDDYEIHTSRWKRSDLTAVLEEFIDSSNKLLNGKINIEKFTVDLVYIVEWIINSCVSFQDDSTVTDEFRKHLGGDGPGTALQLESVQNLMLEMEKIHSACKVEIKGLKNELSLIKTSGDASSPVPGRQGNEALLHKLAQSQRGTASLQNEMETLKESKRMTEDQLENLKVANEDLETQLTFTTAKLHELLQKLSSAEVELDDKSHCCQELEGTCLELQLQLESIANNPYAEEGRQLQTGMEITAAASAKLAECEETIVKLGKQLKALDMSDGTKLKLKQRSSLRDQMMREHNGEASNEESPKTKQIISTTVENVVSSCNYNAITFPDGQIATPTTYLGTKNEGRNVKSGAIVVAPDKRKGGGGISFLRKLLIRRKKGSTKNTSIYFGK